MASTFWIGTNVKVTNGSATVEVTSGDVITKVKENAMFVASNFSLPYEVDRTYTNNGKDYIVLKEDWQGASGTGLNAVAVTSPAGIEEARQTLINLISVYEGFANDVKPTVEGDAIVQRTSAGRIKTANAVSSDEAVAYGQLGSAATRDVTTSITDTNEARLMKVSDFGIGERAATEYPSDNFDDATVPCGFYRLINGNPSTGTRPEGFSNYAYCQVQTYDNKSKLQTVVDASGKKAYRVFSNTNLNEWIYDYNSKNSVNPLDFGLGGYKAWPNGVNLDDLTNTETGFYRQYIPTGGASLPAKYQGVSNLNFVVLLMKEATGRAVQTLYDAKSRAVCHRIFSGSWQPWVELYHSGNTNFNEFGGVNAGDIISTGVATSATEARFFLPLNSQVSATGITLGTGLYSIKGLNGANTGNNNLTLSGSFSTLSGNKVLVLIVTGLSGLTAGESYRLETESVNSIITVNF